MCEKSCINIKLPVVVNFARPGLSAVCQPRSNVLITQQASAAEAPFLRLGHNLRLIDGQSLLILFADESWKRKSSGRKVLQEMIFEVWGMGFMSNRL